MSDDSLPLGLPLWRLADDSCEATTLYRELRKPLLRYLVSLGLSSDEAQDVVQDAFVSLQRHLAAGGSQENIRSWVFRVAHNQARNRQNSYHRRYGETLDGDVDPITDEATPEQAVLEKEVRTVEEGDPLADAAGTRMSAVARRRITVSRNRGCVRDGYLNGRRNGGAGDQEIGGEMQCVTSRED